ncbi:hypothetical protein C2W64_00347 [Brevibacillus laterosporus]|nr:hypothetical protein C2W64_00347 [Brevibacillus laterosporus]
MFAYDRAWDSLIPGRCGTPHLHSQTNHAAPASKLTAHLSAEKVQTGLLDQV